MNVSTQQWNREGTLCIYVPIDDIKQPDFHKKSPKVAFLIFRKRMWPSDNV